MFDRVAGGRAIKCLVVVDDATHEAVAIEPAHNFSSSQLICSRASAPHMDRDVPSGGTPTWNRSMEDYETGCPNEHRFTSLHMQASSSKRDDERKNDRIRPWAG